jgi:uncharacterized protein YcbK (DUF882 family)
MEKVNINNEAKLSEHFTLCEMTKTKHVTKDGNIPSRVIIENLRRLCTDWLEELRRRYNRLYGDSSSKEKPIIINSGYRSPEVNRLAGGVASSNHLTGCAADIRVLGNEQLVRYATILLDISDESGEAFDELIFEHNSRTGNYWLHFAVRASGNRRKIKFINK